MNTVRKLYVPLLIVALLVAMVLPAQAADSNVQVVKNIQASEATAAKRTIVFPGVTGQIYVAGEIDLSKDGGTFAAADAGITCAEIVNASAGATGQFKLVLAAADVDTEGELAVEIDDQADNVDQIYITGIRIVDHDPFDDIAAILADTGTDGVQIPAGEITATSFGAGAIDAAALSADAGAELADAIWDEATVGHAGAGTAGKALTDVLDDTGTSGVVLPAGGILAATFGAGAIDAAALNADAGAEIADTIWDEAVAGHVGAATTGKSLADILDDTGTSGVQIPNGEIVLATFGAGAIDATVLAANTIGASEFASDAVNEIVDQTWDELAADHVGAGSISKAIQDGVSAAGVADAVWDELTAGHVGAGSTSQALISILDDTGTSGVVVASVAATVVDAVWDEATAGHVTAGTVGKALADVLDDTGTSGVQIPAGEIVATTFGAGAIDAAATAADFITEIAAGINAEDEGIYYYVVQRNEPTAARRTLYFRALGTLPAKASISSDGASFANSTNAPATVNGNFRKLELTAAEVSTYSRKVINITTTSTVDVATLIVDVVRYDPFTEGAVIATSVSRGM